MLVGVAFVLGNRVFTTSVCGAECQQSTIQQTQSVSPAEFAQMVESNAGQLLDIRTKEEFDQGHLAGALQIDFYQTQAFSNYLDTLDPTQPYLVYCRSGNRSSQAMKLMNQKGFTQVTELKGGIAAWQNAGFQIER
jgi:rhodanese-related sulfurtransferase